MRIGFSPKRFIAVFLFSFITSPAAWATVYSNANSGLDGWVIFDATPAGASINNVNDRRVGSRVIQTQGDGRNNGYLLGGITRKTGWNNTDEPQLEWKMSTSEAFSIQVYVNTSAGLRRVVYNQSNSDLLKNPGNNTIHFGLGSAVTDGSWRTHSRNLSDDVSRGEPGNTLVSVYGFVVLGSIRIDDLSLLSGGPGPGADAPPLASLVVSPAGGSAPLSVQVNASGSSDDIGIANYAFNFGDRTKTKGSSSTVNHVYNLPGVYRIKLVVTDSSGQKGRAARSITVTESSGGGTVYSDAEGGVGDWVVSDKKPGGATVTAVLDAVTGSQVIQTKGAGLRNSFLLGGTKASNGWNNRTEFAFGWYMSTNSKFSVEVNVDTQLGKRRLIYNNSNTNSLKHRTRNTIQFGLGSATVGGGWISHQRDLAADVSTGEPGNRLLAVHGVLVRGNLRIDNIGLSSAGVVPPSDTAPSAAIVADKVTGSAPLSVFFSASDSAAVAPATLRKYVWKFGNGKSAKSSNASQTYTQPGVYQVSLKVTDSNAKSDTANVTITVTGGTTPPSGRDPGAPEAARLLAQASFGATTSEIARVRRLGIERWVDDQLTLRGGSHLAWVRNFDSRQSLSGPRQHKWMIDAIDGPDQLRNRMAFALSQIFVTSDVTQVLRREQWAMTNYYDLLRNNAFGNYRQLLEEVTLSPIMGIYLSMLQNAPGDPSTGSRADENYAREIMQLFSIGLHQLKIDGTPVKASNGRPKPAYTQADVQEYARIYTGWTYADADRFNNTPAGPNTDTFLPMRPFPGFHDSGRKNLLRGGVSPAGISAQRDLDNALDSIFNHPNVGPFFGTQLIKRLVTSNPTPAYVRRVARVFNNNGSGVRGDLGAVVKAILLDTEARAGYRSVPNFGKIREPLLRWTHLWRAFNVQRGAESAGGIYNIGAAQLQAGVSFLGQAVLSAPSVFNFYHPEYAPLGAIRDRNLTAPEAEIYSDALILSTTSKLTGLTQNQWHGASANNRNRSYLDLRDEVSIASNPPALIDRLNLLLMSGQMSNGLRRILLSHMNALPGDAAGRSQRVRDGITLVMASPEYLVQK